MDYQDAIKWILVLATSLTLSGSVHHDAFAQQGPQFSLPLDCSGSSTCLVQNMVDMDTGPGHRDPFCNAATYDSHKGTDIRVRHLADLQRGIAVLAMADGVVTKVRNNVRERLMETPQDRARTKGRECGNGLLIDHGALSGARHTVQYCHLARESISVRKGDRVSRGQIVGRMGLSGATEFPHLHFSVRKNGRLIDPLTGSWQSSSCERGDTSTSLLSGAALETLLEKGFEPLLDEGFAGGPVSGKAVLRSAVVTPRQPGPLVYYASFINLQMGDMLRLKIVGPEGIFAESQTRSLSGNKATFTAYTGRKGRVKPGKYKGGVELVRDGKVIFSRFSATISF